MGSRNGWPGRPALRRWAVTVMVLLASVGLPAQAQVPERIRVEGDARAWEEMMSAWERLQGLQAYRVRQRNPDGTLEMVFEFERTPRGHAVRIVTTVRHGGQEIRSETVRIGDLAWQVMPMPGGGSTCRQIPPDRVPPGAFVLPEPGGGTAAEEVVWARRVGPGTSPRGAPVTVYEWRSRRADEVEWKVTGTLHVDQASGLPVWMTFEAERQRFTAEYYDFNASVRVTRPAGC